MPILVGNVQLTKIKSYLKSFNLDSEFREEGVLVVNNHIVIKKVFFSCLILEFYWSDFS